MSGWKLPLFGGPAQQTPSPPQHQNYQNIPTESWYPPSVSRPSTPGGSNPRAQDFSRSQSNGQPSPTEAASVISRLRDKSVEELRRILNDKEAYNAFCNTLDQVKVQNNLRDELRKETIQLARQNLEQEPRIVELRNQSTIIRTTELAAAQEKLAELDKQKEEILRSNSPSSLLEKLHEAMRKADEESEMLQNKLMEKEMELQAFVQKYKKLRATYHKRALMHLAAKTTV
ncbi:hypothetical protein LUZ60_005699 [Juncus effusus]|nr:hypothetical protein LUZ60_005699 [Juncus effusus]